MVIYSTAKVHDSRPIASEEATEKRLVVKGVLCLLMARILKIYSIHFKLSIQMNQQVVSAYIYMEGWWQENLAPLWGRWPK